jgi:outer membrane protein
MNRKLALRTALAAGLLPLAAYAQVSPAPPQSAEPAPAASAPASPQPQGPAAPTAFPAKIAVISFEEAVYLTNEGQRAAADIAKKYESQKAVIVGEADEIESLRKQLAAAPATLSNEEKASRERAIDLKEKKYQSDVENAQTAYNGDLQDALQKVAVKVNAVMQTYLKVNGYSIAFDAGNQQSSIMWISQDPNADITQAVIGAYNASTPGITAPPPAAPTPSSAPRKPATSTTPRSTTPSTAPKPQSK